MIRIDDYNVGMKQIDVNLASLDLNLITALDALLRLHSVSGAAEAVGRTQSAMSHSLARLRDHFRDPILVRDGWAMHPTPLAEQLRPRVAEAARAARLVFETKTVFDPATTRRRIRIASPDLCASLFTSFIAELSRDAPNGSIEFVAAESARQAVLNSDADIGLGFGHPKSDPNLLLCEIGPLEWCTFAPRGHPFCKDASQARWAASQHIVVGQSGAREGPVEKALRRNRLKRRVVCHVANFSSALSLAAETQALFTTLRAPFERSATRLGMAACAVPFPMPSAPAALMFRADYGDPFSIWVRERCLRSFD